ncbi:MAG: HAMP domain-containing histidine kinase [Comamonadaceae bacterium]|nr:MAG: HAMP domain-containing histidine kinase [Comamonadaceae bacterium]
MKSRPWSSIAFRLALNYGALVLLTMCMVLAVFYVQTVGVLQLRIDRENTASIDRLFEGHTGEPSLEHLTALVKRELRDGEKSDTEIYLLLDASGDKVVGNIDALPPRLLMGPAAHEARVVRAGRATVGRLQVRMLEGGGWLVVGSDLHALRELERLYGRASLFAALITLVMAVGGAFVFRGEVEERAGAIRRTMASVAEGNLQARIPVMEQQDEFTRLDRDVNAMLDRLELLMDGVRHVSNTIAHNLRTPLTRILLRLRSAEGRPAAEQAQALQFAATEVAELGVVFDKLLHIAEVESGARRQAFAPVALDVVVTDVLELYEPVAEERGIRVCFDTEGPAMVVADADLIASALANLIDNALKYTAPHGQGVVQVRLQTQGEDEGEGEEVVLTVRDNGRGVPAADLQRIGTRFYRVDHSREGYGLGLASVQAIVRLHGGQIAFLDAAPGLHVRVSLPAPQA